MIRLHVLLCCVVCLAASPVVPPAAPPRQVAIDLGNQVTMKLLWIAPGSS